MDDDATRRRPPGSTPALVAMTDADGVVTYTVGELTGAINSALRDAFGGGVWVVGEISGLTVRGPHTYFSLVEEVDGEKASMNVQFFAYAKKALRPLLAQHRLELTDGTRIRIKGTLDVYAPTGRLGLKLSDIDPQFTLGDISAARDAVLRQLAADGLLERNAQVPMPTVPLHIGVVTSVGSAAWHDLTDQLVSSGVGFQISAVDARVQGDDAPAMVAAGITTLAERGVDVVVVCVEAGHGTNSLRSTPPRLLGRSRGVRCRSSPGLATRSITPSLMMWPTRRIKHRRRSLAHWWTWCATPSQHQRPCGVTSSPLPRHRWRPRQVTLEPGRIASLAVLMPQ